MKSILNFEHLEINMNLRAYILTKIRTPKYVVKQMFKNSRCGRPYNKQHGKRSKTPLKSARQRLYERMKEIVKERNWVGRSLSNRYAEC